MNDHRDNTDELPGDYDTLDGIKTRAIALGNPVVPRYINRAEDRVEFSEKDGAYRIEPPQDVDSHHPEVLFHLGILTGAALESKYPGTHEADSEGSDTETR